MIVGTLIPSSYVRRQIPFPPSVCLFFSSHSHTLTLSLPASLSLSLSLLFFQPSPAPVRPPLKQNKADNNSKDMLEEESDKRGPFSPLSSPSSLLQFSSAWKCEGERRAVLQREKNTETANEGAYLCTPKVFSPVC